MLQYCLLSTAYAPPPLYFHQIAVHENSKIEAHENYQKQSFRNRCIILSSNGLQSLTIPTKHGNSLFIRDIEIETRENWQKKHWKSIETCYGTSPYFTFYRDYFEPLFNKPCQFLFDWNIEIINTFCAVFKITTPKLTETWNQEYIDVDDCRNSIHPKRALENTLRIYPSTFPVNAQEQVYLSSFDLLFNLGPDAVGLLIK